MESALFWLLLNLITILILAFFSMEEMAFVSFNKVRLQFYVSQGSQRAIWLNRLLQNPSQLFATTLIGVNVATFVGSECARRFHEALGISPDLAPISQIFLVIVFGELAPMFAARRYSEHVALLGVPIIYASSKLLAPFIWIVELISKLANRLLGGHEAHPNLLITQEELQKILEEQEDDRHFQVEDSGLNAITSNIFRLRNKLARHVMTPLTSQSVISAQTTVGQLREQRTILENYVLVYLKKVKNIIGVVFIKDLIRAPDTKRLHDFCNPPWFITVSTPLTQILQQFRRSSENVAIVLDELGQAVGYLTFDDILDEIVSKTAPVHQKTSATLIDRTVNADMTIEEFNKEFNTQLSDDPDETLSSWLIRTLEHHPEPGETVLIPPYRLTIKETSLLGITTVQLQTWD